MSVEPSIQHVRVDSLSPVHVDEPIDRSMLSEAKATILHCGSGLNFRDHCLNSDIKMLEDDCGGETCEGGLYRVNQRFLYLCHDASQPFPIASESCDHVFAEHFIEHLPQEEAVHWLREMGRLLKPGGSIRISTPDLATYVKGYLDPEDRFYRRHRKCLEKMGVKRISKRRAWMLNQIFFSWDHQWIYDFDEIRFTAKHAGFSESRVRRCKFREGRDPLVAQMDRLKRRDESLYVEIDKPL